MGGTTITWNDGSTIFAAIWPVSANEATRSGQLSMDITHRIRVRYRRDIKGSWRLKFGERYFNIVSIINPNTANRSLDILCKETES